MRRVSVVLLVDVRGRLLLQERDENAPTAPDQWGMVGGQVEDDEDPEAAAYRELLEETGLRWSDGLRCWQETSWGGPDRAVTRYFLWTAATSVTDADITVGEGRQIVFVDPVDIADLDLAASAAHFVPAFLASDAYADALRA